LPAARAVLAVIERRILSEGIVKPQKRIFVMADTSVWAWLS